MLRAGRGAAQRTSGVRGCGGPGAATARAATHLSELQGRDDGDDDAHETDVEPIPVGQAGIGLSLEELEQHHPGRRHATPRHAQRSRRHFSEPPFKAPAGPPRSGHSLRSPRIAAPGSDARSAPRRGRRFREPGAHALGAAEADLRPARRLTPPGSAGKSQRQQGRQRHPAAGGARTQVCALHLRVRGGLCGLGRHPPIGLDRHQREDPPL